MEIKGEDFIKKVQAQQETNELKQRLDELNNIINESKDYTPQPITEEEIVDLPEQELGNIMLGDKTGSSGEKKKYVILGLMLVILFVITVVIIRFLTSDTGEQNSLVNSDDKNSKQEKMLEDNNIEQQYQKIIANKLKKIKEREEKELKEKDNTLDIEKAQKEEIPLPKPKPKPAKKEIKTAKTTTSVKDIFGLKEEKPKKETKKKKKISKEAKKTAAKKQPIKKELKWPRKKRLLHEPEVTNFANSLATTKPSGSFVQIGAFIKEPSKLLLSSITKAGYTHRLYKVKIKDKIYTKVLIGPYKNRKEAKLNIDKIKKRLNAQNAFILNF